MDTITLPLHRVGERYVDLTDLFRQLDSGADRSDITVRRYPAHIGRGYQITVNNRPL
jgi:hypothetical protein